MNPLAGDIWFYVAVAYVLVSLSMWIIARFSPLEWYLLKHPNLEESLCHEHDAKVFPSDTQDCGPGDEQHHHCCHQHHRLLRPGNPRNPEQVKVDDNDNFQETDESDFNKQQQPRVVGGTGGEGEAEEGQQGDIKSRNEFQTYNEGCSCDNHSTRDDHHQLHFSHHHHHCQENPGHGVINKREGPRVNPLDLLEDMPMSFDVPRNVAVMDECDEEGHLSHPNGASLRHTHNETELLSSANDFTLSNSFWFMIGTLMQQGSDLNPKVKIEECPLPFVMVIGASLVKRRGGGEKDDFD